MKRKWDIKDYSKFIYSSSSLQISKEANNLYFEHLRFKTEDIAEAVSYLMYRKELTDSSLWSIEVDGINKDVSAVRCLYWLSGGKAEWSDTGMYSTTWVSVYDIYEESFGYIILDIIKSAKTLGEIRDLFIKYIPLQIFWEFALKNNIIRDESCV